MSRPITASAINETHGWTASRRTDVDRAIRVAGRHSRLVRVVRIALPVGVIVGLTALVLNTYFKPMQIFDKLPSVSGKLAVQGSKITMELPRIAGFTRDARAYELNAETAVQDITSPDLIELQNLRAKMEMQDKDVVLLVAKSGTYNSKADKVILRDEIVITSEQGYKALLREAAIEMKKGNVVSDHPVTITLPNGLLKANRLEVFDSGALIRFDRGVVLDLDGQKKEASQ
jgi:lipopolysaccharide export system protein LptC